MSVTIPKARMGRPRQQMYPGMVRKSSTPNFFLVRRREAKRKATTIVSRTVKAMATFRRRSPELTLHIDCDPKLVVVPVVVAVTVLIFSGGK